MGRFRLRGRRRRDRRERTDRIPVRAIIPNMVTSLAACSGIASIAFSSEGNFVGALWALFLACVCDGMDGRVARMLKASSKLGAELDSLADFVNFGVAPAMFMYFWLTGGPAHVGCDARLVKYVLGAALFYAMCDCFRLARFNTMLEQESAPYWRHFFTGVPAPGGCWIVLSPAILSIALESKLPTVSAWLHHPFLGLAALLFVGSLMASRLPTISLKHARISRKWQLPLTALLLLFIAFLVSNFWLTIGVCGFIYLFTIPVTVRAFIVSRNHYEAANRRLDLV